MTRYSTAAALVLLATAAPAPLWAAEANVTPPFPTARADAAVMVWVSRNTSLPTGRSVVISPDNFLVVVSDVPDAANPSIHRVRFRQEATHIDFVSRTGGRSVEGEADVDCVTGATRARSVVLYSGTDLKGARIAAQGADADWRAPFAGTASALVMGEVCGYRQPTPPAVVAAASPPPAPRAVIAPIPAPRPAAPPPAPAPIPAPIPPRAPVAAQAPPAPTAPRAAPGPYTAQLGAFGSREAAQSYWGEVTGAFPAEFSGRTVRITSVQAGGQTLWRVGVPGFTQVDGRAVCATIEATGRGCFVRIGD
jgi:hypothetical protein